MQLGRKSIVTTLVINNQKVLVQANKNFGICDIEPRVGEVLSDFQGQQINDEYVISRLKYALVKSLEA